MEKAKELLDFYSVFEPFYLNESDIEEFYCAETMKYRTSDEFDSPIEAIKIDVTRKTKSRPILFLGHKGCGKSTELIKLKSELEQDGYCVVSINCILEIDLQNAVYWDLFILITEKLVETAKELECEIKSEIINMALHYWKELEITETSNSGAEYGISSGLEAKAGLLGLFNAFVKIKADLKNGVETRTVLRQKVERNYSNWILIIETFVEEIIKKSGGKTPILILEELDKMNEVKAMDIFYNSASALSQLPFKAIYTFPINLFYSEKFSTLENYFDCKTLPMIKVRNKDMSDNAEGINIIKEIVYKRADKSFFEVDVLDYMIKKTGGSLRDLFGVMIGAARRANARGSEQIKAEDANIALRKLKSELSARIEEKDYEFLKNAHEKKTIITERKELLKFMEGQIILEYNCERWHALHPLVLEFLEENGVTFINK